MRQQSSDNIITLGQLQDGDMFRHADMPTYIFTRIRQVNDIYIEVERPWDKERTLSTHLSPVKLPGIYYTGLTLGELGVGDEFMLPANKNIFEVLDKSHTNSHYLHERLVTTVRGASGGKVDWYNSTQVLKQQLTLF